MFSPRDSGDVPLTGPASARAAVAPLVDVGVTERGIPYTRTVRSLGRAALGRYCIESVIVFTDGAVVRRREELDARQAAQRYGLDVLA